MAFYTLHSGIRIQTEDRPFASGGEGTLHRILQPGEYRGYVLKLYKPEKQTPVREAKILYLAENTPALPEDPRVHPSLIWVKDAAYQGRRFVGFIMPLASGDKLDILTSLKLHPRLQAHWGRFALAAPDARRLRLRLCFNIAVAVQHLHATGRYVLVDLKPENILIRPNGLISIVDTDSVEVVEDGRVVYAAPVATPEFTPPEYYVREHAETDLVDESWDRFSLAVIFYKLLFGIHPYAGNNHRPPYHTLNTLDEMIRHGLFPHGSKAAWLGMVPPPHRAFIALPQELRTLFLRAFDTGHSQPENRPTAAEWCRALAVAAGLQLPSQVQIISFQADKQEVHEGEPVQVRWKTENPKAVYLSGAGFLPAEGEITVPAWMGARLELQVWDADGNHLRQTLPLRVTQPVPTLLLPIRVHTTFTTRFTVWLFLFLALGSILYAVVRMAPWVWYTEMAATALIAGAIYWRIGKRFAALPERVSQKQILRQLEDSIDKYRGQEQRVDQIRTALERINQQALTGIEEVAVELRSWSEKTLAPPGLATLEKKKASLKRKLEKAGNAYTQEQNRCEEAVRQARQRYRQELRLREYEKYVILFQDIPSLRPSDKDNLLAYGFRTAADLEDVNISTGDLRRRSGAWVHIPKIGPTKAAELKAWLTRVTAKVDTALPAQILLPEQSRIEEPYRQRMAALQAELNDLHGQEVVLKAQLEDKKSGFRRKAGAEKEQLLKKMEAVLAGLDYFHQAIPLREALDAEVRGQAAAGRQLLQLTQELSRYRHITFRHYLYRHFI